MKKWCRHMRYFEGWHFVAGGRMWDMRCPSWRFCPICGAKRPRRGAWVTPPPLARKERGDERELPVWLGHVRDGSRMDGDWVRRWLLGGLPMTPETAREDDHVGWKVGWQVCSMCRNRHVAVWPADMVQNGECPQCHNFTCEEE